MTAPTLYLDFGSPYAYLAVERIGSVLAGPVELQPVLLGAIFKRRGWGSWAETDGRADGMAEVEARARRYGLPPIVWPQPWPGNALAADRAGIWARDHGAAERFIPALFRHEFQRGADISRPEALADAAAEAGLDPEALIEGIQQPQVKEALRAATEEAWELGVRGVPTLRIGDAIFYGDDSLEDAATQAAQSR